VNCPHCHSSDTESIKKKTLLEVEGRWCYLYRAIDKEGNLIDVYLSDVRDRSAAEKSFMQSQKTTGITPTQITR
jgi:transposase-like protein